jgi:hypothetical protein
MRRLLLVGLLAGCSEDPPACLTPAVDVTCSPGFVPTFPMVYENTLKPNCGYMDGSCHSASGRAGGLSFETQQVAYDQLMTAGRVKPFDPTCSEFVVRTHSPGKDYEMPPGEGLSKEEQCALALWVNMGAQP